jgi:hypothetical protein
MGKVQMKSSKMFPLCMIVFVGLLCSDRPTFAQSVVATIPVGVFPFGVAVCTSPTSLANRSPRS